MVNITIAPKVADFYNPARVGAALERSVNEDCVTHDDFVRNYMAFSRRNKWYARLEGFMNILNELEPGDPCHFTAYAVDSVAGQLIGLYGSVVDDGTAITPEILEAPLQLPSVPLYAMLTISAVWTSPQYLKNTVDMVQMLSKAYLTGMDRMIVEEIIDHALPADMSRLRTHLDEERQAFIDRMGEIQKTYGMKTKDLIAGADSLNYELDQKEAAEEDVRVPADRGDIPSTETRLQLTTSSVSAEYYAKVDAYYNSYIQRLDKKIHEGTLSASDIEGSDIFKIFSRERDLDKVMAMVKQGLHCGQRFNRTLSDDVKGRASAWAANMAYIWLLNKAFQPWESRWLLERAMLHEAGNTFIHAVGTRRGTRVRLRDDIVAYIAVLSIHDWDGENIAKLNERIPPSMHLDDDYRLSMGPRTKSMN